MPIQNVKNLLLKDEVVEAIKEGKFNIYAIKSIEEGRAIIRNSSGLKQYQPEKNLRDMYSKFLELC